VVYPIVFTAIRSLFSASGSKFVGLRNYHDVFTSHQTLVAIRNNAIWVAVAPPIVTFAGLIFAVLTERISWSTAFKTVVFMPMAISFVAAGVIFRLAYDASPERGVINAAINSTVGLFRHSGQYVGARPRETTVAQFHVGDVASVPYVGLPPARLPSSAEAALPALGQSDRLVGTVWLDFAPGGGGQPGVIDSGEKGMPGFRVQAVSGGKLVASTTADDHGRFVFTGLRRSSIYVIRAAKFNFQKVFNGIDWLGPSLVTPSIIGAYLWIWAGFAMVLIAAGLAAIPREALEAARVDGANEWQVFVKVTVPLLAPVLLVVIVTLIINVLKVFDLVLIIPPGSVEAQADVLALEMWRVSFGGGHDQGLGSALAILLFALVVPAMVFNIRRLRREVQ
jgi:alpha-glucoside transport system permease protein